MVVERVIRVSIRHWRVGEHQIANGRLIQAGVENTVMLGLYEREKCLRINPWEIAPVRIENISKDGSPGGPGHLQHQGEIASEFRSDLLLRINMPVKVRRVHVLVQNRSVQKNGF